MNKWIKYTVLLTGLFLILTLISAQFIEKKNLGRLNFYLDQKNKTLSADQVADFQLTKEFEILPSDDIRINATIGQLRVIAKPIQKVRVHVQGKMEKNKTVDFDQYIYKKGNRVQVDLGKIFEDDEGILKMFQADEKAILFRDVLDLEVQVPENIGQLNINIVSANVLVEGIQAKRLDLNTVSGDLDLKKSKLQTIDINSVSGQITMDQSLADDIDIKTISGDFEFKSQENDIYDITFKSASGELTGQDLFSGTGSNKKIQIKTVSGDAAFEKN